MLLSIVEELDSSSTAEEEGDTSNDVAMRLDSRLEELTVSPDGKEDVVESEDAAVWLLSTPA